MHMPTPPSDAGEIISAGCVALSLAPYATFVLAKYLNPLGDQHG